MFHTIGDPEAKVHILGRDKTQQFGAAFMDSYNKGAGKVDYKKDDLMINSQPQSR